MVVTYDHKLPTFEELTVEEVPISTPGLRAGAHHFGNYFIYAYMIVYNFTIFVHIVMFRKILPRS